MNAVIEVSETLVCFSNTHSFKSRFSKALMSVFGRWLCTRYRWVCECGDHSRWFASRTTTQLWAQEHREMCCFLSNRERTVEIEESVR